MSKKEREKRWKRETGKPYQSVADERIADAKKQIDKNVAEIEQQIDKHKQAADSAGKQFSSDREMHEHRRLLTLQKLREQNAKDLFATVTESLVADRPEIAVTFQPRRVSPNVTGKVSLPRHNFYQECAESEAVITIMPDALNGLRRPQYLKHVKEINTSMRGRLLWALDNHPLGWVSPLNWIMVVDDALTALNVEQFNDMVEGVNSNKTQPLKGTISSIRDNNGELLVGVVLENTSTVTAPMLISDKPKIGMTGSVSYDEDGNATFTPNE